ncbi:ATP-binding response regulator [Chitinophaga ginsengisegetis]|uniref:ATP-binding response regulator n=1 Tax=Chitinophaga ginsengisegetis TaxID=393003 RepID=UPI000DBA41E4|nr:hybrid sensor histidine kinase/response regulator [Chitinophaga ginsengisegetis]MDR6568580.1 signal transduction histidine kinase/CheY-like chemotaxis protein [Chitinophaga ginsengisegetis]MDR6648189.1 signal transduction histidine kinase/CheY-like chemotaxis protein [Chitinophaga ginsengisegetis]MDR6654661.1 signal transduction histidine kinase/CheY-like chemotaxis protein [Chitinophaga ginsengisegetis]
MNIGQLFHRVVNTGTSRQEESLAKVTRMVNTFSVITTALCLLFGAFIYLGTGKLDLLIPAYIEAGLFLGVLLLNAANKPVLASIAFVAINNVAIVYFSAVMGMLTEVHLLFLFLLGASLMIFRTRTLVAASIVVAVVSVIACEINYYHALITPMEMGHDQQFLIRWITLPAILLLDVATIFLYVRKLKTLNTKLTKATDEKTIFVRETSHEIRNPLNAIYGISQDLMMKVHKEERYNDIRPEIEHLYSATHNVLQIINNVLAISKIEDGAAHAIHPESFNIRELISDKIIVYQYIADLRGIKIRADIAEDMPCYILADKNKLAQVLNNLLFNAIKFTRTNSLISVGVSHEGSQWQFLVKDQGQGIPDADLVTLFTPFKSGKSDFEGTGLGLPITKKYVEMMGGKITVTSIPEEGATFIVRLPLTVSEAPSPAQGGWMELTLHKGLKSLVIDDNEMSQVVLSNFLRRLGFTTMVAGSGAEGINKAMDEKPDLIFIDSYMPGLSGKDTLQKLGDIPALKNIPVIAVSGDAFQESIDDMLGAGAREYISKPIDLKLLNNTVNKVLFQ